MQYTPEVSNQWKLLPNNNETWYKKIVQKIGPPDPIQSGRRTRITESFD